MRSARSCFRSSRATAPTDGGAKSPAPMWPDSLVAGLIRRRTWMWPDSLSLGRAAASAARAAWAARELAASDARVAASMPTLRLLLLACALSSSAAETQVLRAEGNPHDWRRELADARRRGRGAGSCRSRAGLLARGRVRRLRLALGHPRVEASVEAARDFEAALVSMRAICERDKPG